RVLRAVDERARRARLPLQHDHRPAVGGGRRTEGGRVMAAVQERVSACAAMRAASEHVWERIYSHPFLRDVEDGTITDERLLHYFIQNVHYIDAAVRFTSEAAAKAPTRRSLELCLYLAQFGSEEA